MSILFSVQVTDVDMGIKVEKEMQLVMWERQEMKDRAKDPNTGEWRDTGSTVEKTRYYLRDEFGDKLEFLGDNEYRTLEGDQVLVSMDISFNEFQNKNVVKLESIVPLQ